MPIDATLIADVVLGLMALGAVAAAWGRPFRIANETPERAVALERLERLEREFEERAAWRNPHARPRGTGEPVGERRVGDYPRLRLVGNTTCEHVREAHPAS
ncbi:MAG: hypothetical protein QOH00_3376 [Gaiellales bacterium]|jgi:hypothetical protein|nr:hypothetical protein [Gaiellales bacterium]